MRVFFGENDLTIMSMTILGYWMEEKTMTCAESSVKRLKDTLSMLAARGRTPDKYADPMREAVDIITDLQKELTRAKVESDALVALIHGDCRYCKRTNNMDDPLCLQCCHFAARELVKGDYWELSKKTTTTTTAPNESLI